MDIKILPPEVVDQIAAGEVVERPAHLVKELVENSLDALATKVEIDVDLGGRKIKISDNGTGIYADDLPLVCARHATSKISQADDLWKLSTYGFRGEALASIASVSRLKLVSKKKGEAQAYVYENHFGVSQKPLVTGGEYGTIIEIEDLFSNVPARLKFLKSDAAEVSQIKNAVKALALAYPKVEFKFKQQGKVVFYYPADTDTYQRAKKVLEVKDLYRVENSYQNYRLELIYSSPHVTVGSSKQIWIFVENRWVNDKTIQSAIMGAYRSLLMHGEYPYIVIKISTPPGEVDVNIHPTKSQVKFTDSSFIFKWVHNALRAELEKAPWLGDLDLAAPRKVDMSAPNPSLFFKDQSFEQVQYSKKTFEAPTGMTSSFSGISSGISSGIPNLAPHSASSSTLNSPTSLSLDPLPWKSDSSASTEGAAQSPATAAFWSKLQVLGQTHLTYILAEGQNALFLIDQHAAHERVVFEKLISHWKKSDFEVQGFLFPLSIELSAEQVEAMVGLREDFLKMGVELDQAGPETILVNSAPSFISEKALSKSIVEFAHEISQDGGSFSFEKKVIDVFATMACHSVVRAGQALSVEQMQSLLQQMDEFSLSSYCPHGRNVFVEIPYSKIERDFGRLS
jgi:DNA mismatch repair protein MutL